MGYSAGNLELSILGFSEKAVASIDVTAKALGRLASSVNKLNSSDVSHSGQALEYLFSKIAKSTDAINTANIESLASAAKSLSSISKLSNLGNMDFEKVGKGFATLSVAIEPFLNKVKEAEASLTALDGILRRSSGKKIQAILGGGTSGKNNRGGIFGLAKIGFTIYSVRRLGGFMEDLVQAGSDYNETLNLWQVAMRNNLDTADQFINKMQKAYGISSKTLMNAQAVFKNMIGSLGQISDATAYALSEALVQMSADYASLYNRTLESAFQNMQSMLAGQVRPIRSAGLDMTETTLFMFYQQLGGTKTMRQLNRTEKQLLSILAVYKQMGSAGALGDMSKTLNQFANQSRMMTEYWAELKTWSGLLLKDLIDQSGLLIHINAFLITTTEIIKAIAKARGLGEENFIDGMFESTELANDAIDELQGKLLDFDKFRSLEGQSTSPLAIDEKLFEAITGYSSQIDQAKNEAQQLAKIWTEFFIVNGKITEQAQILLEVFDAIGAIILGIFAYKIINAISNISTGLISINNTAILLTAGIAMLVYGIKQFIDVSKDMTSLEKMASIILALIAAAIGLYVALNSLKLGVPTAIAMGAALAGGTLAIAASIKQMSIPNYEMGASDIDSGTIFRAGEFGKTEAVYTGSNGKTNVANVKQMEQAFYNALRRYGEGSNGEERIVVRIGEDEAFNAVRRCANRQGLDFAKV